MNEYEAKQEAKRERYLARADKAKGESSAAYQSSKAISDMIPFGQPILVGHHSERHHRSDIKKIDNAMRKSIAADEKADYYQQKAAGVGRAGISSDDPEAVTKLQKKIAGAEHCQELMKSANKIIRQAPKDTRTVEKIAALEKLDYTTLQAEKLFIPDFCGRVGFASYSLQNNNANISRMKKRIAQLETRPAETVEKQHGDITVVENAEENRIQLIFPDKPEDGIRKTLKSYGFRWSRYNGAWQRHLNNNGRYAVKRFLQAIAV